jgi:hypothetical protein
MLEDDDDSDNEVELMIAPIINVLEDDDDSDIEVELMIAPIINVCSKNFSSSMLCSPSDKLKFMKHAVVSRCMPKVASHMNKSSKIITKCQSM